MENEKKWEDARTEVERVNELARYQEKEALYEHLDGPTYLVWPMRTLMDRLVKFGTDLRPPTHSSEHAKFVDSHSICKFNGTWRIGVHRERSCAKLLINLSSSIRRIYGSQPLAAIGCHDVSHHRLDRCWGLSWRAGDGSRCQAYNGFHSQHSRAASCCRRRHFSVCVCCPRPWSRKVGGLHTQFFSGRRQIPQQSR